MIAVAGILMIIATFLPWVKLLPGAVEQTSLSTAVPPFASVTPRRVYTGWDLAQRCAHSAALARCSVVWFETTRPFFTGIWTIGLGVALVGIAVGWAVARRQQWSRATRTFMVASWVVVLFTVGFAVVLWSDLASIIPDRSEPAAPATTRIGPARLGPDPLRAGVMIVAIAALVAVVGATTATISSRRSRNAPTAT
jgi:hypothetical protein